MFSHYRKMGVSPTSGTSAVNVYHFNRNKKIGEPYSVVLVFQSTLSMTIFIWYFDKLAKQRLFIMFGRSKHRLFAVHVLNRPSERYGLPDANWHRWRNSGNRIRRTPVDWPGGPTGPCRRRSEPKTRCVKSSTKNAGFRPNNNNKTNRNKCIRNIRPTVRLKTKVS